MSTRPQKSTTTSQLIRTFTYFIPAPPSRKSGYREKEFDKIMTGILQSGFQLLDFKTQSVGNGLFVFALIKAKNKKMASLDVAMDIQDKFKLSEAHSTPEFLLDELDEDDA